MALTRVVCIDHKVQMRSVHFNDLREKLRVKFTQIFKVDLELFFRVRKFSLEPSKKVPLDGFWDRVTLEEVSFLVFDTNTGGTAIASERSLIFRS